MLEHRYSETELRFRNLKPDDLPLLKPKRRLTWLRIIRSPLKAMPEANVNSRRCHIFLQAWATLKDISALDAPSIMIDGCNSIDFGTFRAPLLRALSLLSVRNLGSLSFLVKAPRLESLTATAVHAKSLDPEIL